MCISSTSAQNGLRSTKWLKSQYQTYSPFDIPMILFHKVIQVITLPDSDGFIFHFFQVAKTQCISQIPTDTLSDDICRIMQAFEGFSFSDQ